MDLLPLGRSLYRVGGPARYHFTHEILKDEETISVIFRNLGLLPSTRNPGESADVCTQDSHPGTYCVISSVISE
uniref:Uncharacterized protein n=1 Tax=Gopherus evgoodei TaxID=1825980 RepID=A0A8C5F180_9SAUR